MGDRMKGYKLCGFTSIRPVLMVIGGSQGSENINNAVRSALNELLQTYQIVHICGKGNIVPELNKTKGYKQFEYVNEELADIFACADLLISRAGATVLFEILALNKPASLYLYQKLKQGRSDFKCKFLQKVAIVMCYLKKI